MGYDTKFKGSFKLDRPLTVEHVNTLNSIKDGLPGTPSGGCCDWKASWDGTEIKHSGAEKSYKYVEWLRFILARYLIPWGYVLNGSVDWHGDDAEDLGRITIVNNVVAAKKATITYE